MSRKPLNIAMLGAMLGVASLATSTTRRVEREWSEDDDSPRKPKPETRRERHTPTEKRLRRRPRLSDTSQDRERMRSAEDKRRRRAERNRKLARKGSIDPVRKVEEGGP